MKAKDLILNRLREASGNPVSGQDLADLCGISRTAIWKNIQSLKNAGFQISAVTNRGYLLEQESESLNTAEIEQFLATDFRTEQSRDREAVSSGKAEKDAVHQLPAGISNPCGKIHVYKVVDSTNIVAKKAIAEAAYLHKANGSLTAEGDALHAAVFASEEQTCGKGRLGRVFYSPASGLYISIVYIPAGGIHDPALLTAAAAVGVCRALNRVYGIDAGIKWVNDVFFNGKKICGILTEGITDFEAGTVEAAVVGIGINIADSAGGFPEQISGTAGSVLGSNPGPLQRNRLAAAVITAVLSALDETLAGGTETMQEYQHRSIFIPGQLLTVFPFAGDEESSYTAVYNGIDISARLRVTLSDGTEKLLGSGEVSLKSAAFTGGSL